jgi:DNA modification methylase
MSTSSLLLQRNSSLEIIHLPLDQLTPLPGAPRRHPKNQIRSLKASIEAFGFNVPVLVDQHNQVVSGHARVAALRELGFATVPAVRLEHLDENAVRAFMVADNRLSELSDWDEALLATVLKELSDVDLSFDIEAIGFSMAEIDLRIEGLGDADPDGDDELALPSGPAVVVPGELWQLGKHRLICGNALEAISWAELMGEERAALVVTDPPYNVPIDGHVSGLGQYRHREFAMACGEMDEAEFVSFLSKAMRHARDFSRQGSLHYWAMDWRHMPELTQAATQLYADQINLCVWVKSNPGMGSLYRSQHELFAVFRNGKTQHRNNVQLGRFGRSRSNVWNYPGANSAAHGAGEGKLLALHPTAKPVALLADAILDSTVRGDIVADAFLGSGSTLIAAEKVGRQCRGIELDPLYCDTIIRRWQRWSGGEAIRCSDGTAFSSIEAAAQAGEAA